MISDNKIANAVSGKTARACDCCLKKRARWYCPADDAFLCQSCDGSVHTANPLARRHDRVRLKTVSLNQPPNPVQLPTWQRGSTRKTRTPRHGKLGNGPRPLPRPNPAHIVPELGAEETTSSQDEDQMLSYRVPISDTTSLGVVEEEESGAVRLQGMSDMDLEEFAADVETLLGKELDEEPVGIQQLGLLNEKDDNTPVDFSTPVKGEDDDEVEIREPFDFCFDNDDDDQDFPTTCEKEKVESIETAVGREAGDWKMMMRLRLDYEAISEAWGSQGSPWMNGQRPEINHQDCWPHCMGGTYGAAMCVPLVHVDEHQMGGTGGHGVVTMGDGGREARVLRYREKRRTRLFAKKIRYEVRKLNAEKRPRMKGRFVKRSFFASNVTPFPLCSK